MRLLTITTRYYLGILVLILIAWSICLYLVLRFEVYDNIDEVLTYRKNILVQSIQKENKIPAADGYHDFTIDRVFRLSRLPKDSFEDTLLYKSERSFDEYRKLTSFFIMDGKCYRLRFFLPHLEEDEMIDTLAYTLPLFLVLLLGGYVMLIKLLNKRIWSPFYQVLDKLNSFNIETGVSMRFSPSNIQEFTALQNGVSLLTEKSVKAYQQQKQFTENAAHEIQTPLSIILTRLELLFQKPINRKQSEVLEDVFGAAVRMSRITETLLLLTKIENDQFGKKERVPVKTLVEGILPFFEEHASKYRIKTKTEIRSEEIIIANPTLLSILFTNLLKNAFVHNKLNGEISIQVQSNIITIANTGDPLNVPYDKLFERFFTEKPGKGAGLGLAIVKGICKINDWKIQCSFAAGMHHISICY